MQATDQAATIAEALLAKSLETQKPINKIQNSLSRPWRGSSWSIEEPTLLGSLQGRIARTEVTNQKKDMFLQLRRSKLFRIILPWTQAQSQSLCWL